MKKLLIVALFAMTAVAHAQNQYYVAATGGSDSNNGSIGAPWATCNHAITVSNKTGGTVINFIASATAHAACSVNSSGASVTNRLLLKCTLPWKDSAGITATHCKMAGSFKVTTANNVDIGALPYLGFEYSNASDNTA